MPEFTARVPVLPAAESAVSVSVPVPIFVRFSGMPVSVPGRAFWKFVIVPSKAVLVLSKPVISVPAVLDVE